MHSFDHDQYIEDSLNQSPIGQLINFKILLKQCIPHLRLKNDDILGCNNGDEVSKIP